MYNFFDNPWGRGFPMQNQNSSGISAAGLGGFGGLATGGIADNSSGTWSNAPINPPNPNDLGNAFRLRPGMMIPNRPEVLYDARPWEKLRAVRDIVLSKPRGFTDRERIMLMELLDDSIAPPPMFGFSYAVPGDDQTKSVVIAGNNKPDEATLYDAESRPIRKFRLEES